MAGAVVDPLLDTSEGNPPLLREILRLMAAEGQLAGDTSVLPRKLRIPNGVRESIKRLIEPLGKDTHSILSIASLTGREFDLNCLAVASEVPRDQLIEMLDREAERTACQAASDGTVYAAFFRCRRFDRDQREARRLARPGSCPHTQPTDSRAGRGAPRLRSESDARWPYGRVLARRALLCAIATRQAFATYSERHPEQPIRVRMGRHVGETINESPDFFGIAVILVARIAALTRRVDEVIW